MNYWVIEFQLARFACFTLVFGLAMILSGYMAYAVVAQAVPLSGWLAYGVFVSGIVLAEAMVLAISSVPKMKRKKSRTS